MIEIGRKIRSPVDEETGVNRRRAIYFRHAPEKTSIFLSTMDGPSPNECYRRPVTVVPQQAMALANSKLTAAPRSVCPQCGAPKLPHHVCPNCGYYKDREVVVTE